VATDEVAQLPIVAAVDIHEELIQMKFQELKKGFVARHWQSPVLMTPEDVAAFQRERGLPVEPSWTIYIEPSSQPLDSRNPGATGKIQAAIAFNTENILRLSVEEIAERLALSMAGRAAHEALEWIRFDDELVVDPHVPTNHAEIAEWFRGYLG
jgi:hypothetical protein